MAVQIFVENCPISVIGAKNVQFFFIFPTNLVLFSCLVIVNENRHKLDIIV